MTELEVAAELAGRHGWPVVLKTCRGGYDGRGVWVVGSAWRIHTGRCA